MSEAEMATKMKEFQQGMDFVNKKINDLRKKYPDKFIAVRDSDVVVYASSMDELSVKAKEKKEDLGFLFVEFISSKETMFIL
jgi:hypothetical protein